MTRISSKFPNERARLAEARAQRPAPWLEFAELALDRADLGEAARREIVRTAVENHQFPGADTAAVLEEMVVNVRGEATRARVAAMALEFQADRGAPGQEPARLGLSLLDRVSSAEDRRRLCSRLLVDGPTHRTADNHYLVHSLAYLPKKREDRLVLIRPLMEWLAAHPPVVGVGAAVEAALRAAAAHPAHEARVLFSAVEQVADLKPDQEPDLQVAWAVLRNLHGEEDTAAPTRALLEGLGAMTPDELARFDALPAEDQGPAARQALRDLPGRRAESRRNEEARQHVADLTAPREAPGSIEAGEESITVGGITLPVRVSR